MLTSRWDTKGYERRKSRCINKRLLPRCLFTLRFSRLMIHAYVFLTCFVHYIYSNAIELRSPRKLSGLFRNYSYFNHRFILSNFYQTKNSSTTNSQNHFHYSIILALVLCRGFNEFQFSYPIIPSFIYLFIFKLLIPFRLGSTSVFRNFLHPMSFHRGSWRRNDSLGAGEMR